MRWSAAVIRDLGARRGLLALLAALACDAQRVSVDAAPNANSAGPLRSALEAGSAAHDRHARASIGCATCHPCGGALQIAPDVRYPGGTTTAGAQVTASAGGTPATCQVGCHSPFGGPPHVVSWTAGPLACTACHAQIVGGSVVSAHFDPAASSSACQTCHDLSRHTSGTVLLTSGDAFDSGCVSCHAGRGQTLGGRTPPLLVGWGDAASGDFHGARPGTCRFDALDPAGVRSPGRGGWPCPAGQPLAPYALRITSRWWYQSGTSGPWAWTCDIETVDAAGVTLGPVLKGQRCPDGTILNSTCNNPTSPSGCYPTTLVTRGFGGTLVGYLRGEGALPCKTCHDGHASANAFLLAAVVNGVPIPAGAIDRAGVGAQALCGACHQGDRHEVCKTCHRETFSVDYGFEGAPVDPAPDGSACFSCHGHEGLRFITIPSPAYPSGHPGGQGDCSHCHGGWAPPAAEHAAPVLTAGPTVTGVTATSATVSWTTNEGATTYVEYGAGTAGYVVGDAAFVARHTVTLTALTPATTYVVRVRSSDPSRNVTESALQSFTTPGPLDVPRADLAPVDASATVGTYSRPVELRWYPVTAPSGTAVEYEVQFASDQAFTFLVNGSMSGPGVPGLTVGDSGWVTPAATTIDGRVGLTYPATVTNIPQDYCGPIEPNVYYWRVRAKDQQGNVSEWSWPGTFGAFAGDPWC